MMRTLHSAMLFMTMIFVGLVADSSHRVDGFSLVAPLGNRNQHQTTTQPPHTLLKMSEPSDTSSDDYYDDYGVGGGGSGDAGVVEVQSETYAPSTGEALVSNVMDLMPDQVAGDVSGETRSAINEALIKLEALNPTEAPTLSPLLNGVYDLRYVGGYSPDWALPSPTRQLALFLYSGGYSPGIFALDLAQKLPFVETGDLEIAISRDQPRVEASINVKAFGGIESDVKVRTRLEVESDVRLRETYESATVMDREVAIPEALRYTRDLYVTYVDDDLLIVRDSSGVPEVLVRKDKTFSKNWGTDPSAMEDLVPPGEGEETF